MKLKYYYNDNKRELEINKVNIFYGYSGAGKTNLSKIIEEGLNGKDKSFSINGSNILKEEFNVIYIDSKESIHEHLKLSSKSYLKKLYYKPLQEYLLDNEEKLELINNQFNDINETLDKIAQKFNKRSSIKNLEINFKLPNNETLINECIDVKIDTDISSSKSREMLFNLITLLNSEEKQTHIIIDNFDSLLDEEAIIHFFNLLENYKGFIYLFTNKPTSIMYSIDKHSIFCVRNNNVFNLSNINYLLLESQENNERVDYVEYMLNEGYLKASGILTDEFIRIKNNSICNLGRMLTSKNYQITNTISYEYVTIIPNNEIEERFLLKINNLINND